MNSRKSSGKGSGSTDRTLKMTDQAFQVLMKEYDTLKDLFSQTENSIQGMFNFYVTLISAVIGGIALIYQLSSSDSSFVERTQMVICGLLILAAIIGTIYLLAIVSRYARLIQYGQSLDAIRLFLINKLKIPVAEIYSRFVNKGTITKPHHRLVRSFKWLAWLLPTGTYQLTMAFINSVAITLATWFILSVFGVTSTQILDSMVTIIIEFILIFNMYNVYSRIALRIWLSDFGLHINPQLDDPFSMLR
jgi:hypothetical protein